MSLTPSEINESCTCCDAHCIKKKNRQGVNPDDDSNVRFVTASQSTLPNKKPAQNSQRGTSKPVTTEGQTCCDAQLDSGRDCQDVCGTCKPKGKQIRICQIDGKCNKSSHGTTVQKNLWYFQGYSQYGLIFARGDDEKRIQGVGGYEEEVMHRRPDLKKQASALAVAHAAWFSFYRYSSDYEVPPGIYRCCCIVCSLGCLIPQHLNLLVEILPGVKQGCADSDVQTCKH
ncbi:hypothetical protein Q5P01_026138 [Channa striata]|uniref:Uncharacterized protein n=1 Tax=Channa striata TaxID=64152 RepID=A0AA88LFV8_CHASR|nr:hypothetical protein Q5P01_026138 [Channa striata]